MPGADFYSVMDLYPAITCIRRRFKMSTNDKKNISATAEDGRSKNTSETVKTSEMSTASETSEASDTSKKSESPEKKSEKVVRDISEYEPVRKGSTRRVAEGFKDPNQVDAEADRVTEDNLELHSMSKRQRRKELRRRFYAGMEDMDTKSKVKYFIHYNKWKIIIPVLVIAIIISTIGTIINNKKPVAISYAIINSPNYYDMNTDVIEKDYMDYYGMTTKKYQIISTGGINYDLDTYEEDSQQYSNSAAYTSFPTNCRTNYYDIIITDKKGLEYCAKTSLIYPVDDVFTTDLANAINKNYSDLLTSAKDYDDNEKVFAIDISNTSFAKSINLDFDQAYICFPGADTSNIENIRKMLNFIFDLGLTFD